MSDQILEQPEVVILARSDYELLINKIVGIEKRLEAEKTLRQENEADFAALADRVMGRSSIRPMKSYVEALRRDFELNNYAPKSWKTVQLTSTTGKPLGKSSKSFLKKALEASGEFEFYQDRRDRRRLMIRFIGRKL